MSNLDYVQKYNNKRKTKKITFDLYLDEEIESEIYNLLNKQKQQKNLKKFIIKALLSYQKQA